MTKAWGKRRRRIFFTSKPNTQVAKLVIWSLFFSILVGIFVLAPRSNAQDITDCTNIGILQNGGFERPISGLTVNSSGGTYPTPQSGTDVYGQTGTYYWNHLDATADTSTYRTYVLPGRANDERMYWYTTEASNQMELQANIGSIGPADGSGFAELNANVRAGLFQDLATVPGEVIRWSLKHRGRSGSETMHVLIGNPTNSLSTVLNSTPRFGGDASSGNTTLTNNSVTRTNSAKAGLSVQSAKLVGSNAAANTEISDGTASWGQWYGEYTDTNTASSTTRFLFESVSPAGGSGNELDSIVFSPVAACPINRTLNSTTATATIDPFDTNSGTYAIVPNETGSSESITAMTRISGSGTYTLNSGNTTFQFSPNGSGKTIYSYTIQYSANGLVSTSTGQITIVARDPYGGANCSVGNVNETSSVTSAQTTVVITFTTPTQANSDNDSDHRSGNCTWTAPDNVYAVDYLVVAGGGGGASGGGGGGGVVTSWKTYLANDTSTTRANQGNPLAVTPGEETTLVVGGGGKRGWGGTSRCSYTGSTANACTVPTRIAANGADSTFGSITAKGGGAGGSGQAAGNPGGSGGGAAYDFTGTTSNANASAVIGATTFGNIGGGATGTGGYRAGSGGGGAGTTANVSNPPSGGNGGIGGQNRDTNYCGSAVAVGNGNTSTSTNCTKGAGGHGGRGVATNIASLNGSTFNEYGCGGGGGLNNNSNTNIPGLEGKAGCASAGTGSSWATFLTTTANTIYGITSVQFNGTEIPTESFGGGGAGTDPEGEYAGSGGSGVVVIRYIVPNVNCPNTSNNTTVIGPIACPYPITITAGESTQIVYNLTYGDSVNGYISYPGTNTDTSTVNTSIGNGTDTVTSTAINSGRTFTFRVANSRTRLAGATYPIQYTIYSGASTSTSYVLLKIIDPDQHTPYKIPVDPRATFINLPIIRLGNPEDTQICFTPKADSTHGDYGNIPTVDRTNNSNTETRTVNATTGQLKLQGTNANLQNAMAFIRITKNSADRYLIPHKFSRFIDVNVSNTAVGGNGSCTFGTPTVIELVPIGLTRRNTKSVRIH